MMRPNVRHLVLAGVLLLTACGSQSSGSVGSSAPAAASPPDTTPLAPVSPAGQPAATVLNNSQPPASTADAGAAALASAAADSDNRQASASSAGVDNRQASASSAGVGNRQASASSAGVDNRQAFASSAGVGNRQASASSAGVGNRQASASGAGVGNRQASASGAGVGSGSSAAAGSVGTGPRASSDNATLAATSLVSGVDSPEPAATAAPTATPPPGFNGQSNLVPAGFPTPTSAGERLQPGGPPRDPGSLAWAHPGPYIAPTWTDFRLNSFAANQRLATTYYFFWHDLTDPARTAHFTSGQFDRPPDPAHYSFLLPQTHEREFGDMLDVGLDFVLPVYWDEPGHPGRTTAETSPHYWSTEGIPPMVQALDQLAAEGKHLQMGMFYDTTILANADLTTPAGKEYFYVNVRDFYSRIPPKYWAAIGNKPVIWLYDTLWISKFDQSSLDYLSDRFAQDFDGLRPYIVREVQWEHSKGVTPQQTLHSDALYGWGAAANGYNPDPALTVGEVGPSFKNTAYCTGGAAHNCFDISRQGGAFFQRQLQAAVASSHRILALETWNEFSEGTEVQETVQNGRQDIDLAKLYIARFKSQARG